MTTIQIDKSDSRLNAVKFLTSCMLKNDNRFHIKHFRVEPSGHAVATDGSRLHWVSDLPLESGYYKVHKDLKTLVLIEKRYDLDTNEGSFPDYTNLLNLPKGSSDFNLECKEDDPSSAYTQVVRAMTETTVNFKFVNDICNVVNDVVNCIVPSPEERNGTEETTKPIHFVLNGFHAVVMPKKV